jgi:hypothetical protein
MSTEITQISTWMNKMQQWHQDRTEQVVDNVFVKEADL